MLRLICLWLLLGVAGQLLAEGPNQAPLAVSRTGLFCRIPVRLDNGARIEGLGAGQGLAYFQNKIYIYGDAETGVIREYRYDPQTPGQLDWTGLEIKLTRRGVDVVPHPTGLTFGTHGVFLGNTVQKVGTIFKIDWQMAKQDGNLDRAIVNQVSDDLAINGTRPEYVCVEGRELIATSDYGPSGNEIRLYDPQQLGRIDRTSAPKVLVAKRPAGPWVQSLCWWNAGQRLILVQNRTEGRGYQLTAVNLDDETICSGPSETLRLEYPVDELEGFEVLPDGRALFLSSSGHRNLWFASLAP